MVGGAAGVRWSSACNTSRLRDRLGEEGERRGWGIALRRRARSPRLLEGLDQVGGPLFPDLPGDEGAAVGVGGDVYVVVPGGAVAGQKSAAAPFPALDF